MLMHHGQVQQHTACTALCSKPYPGSWTLNPPQHASEIGTMTGSFVLVRKLGTEVK